VRVERVDVPPREALQVGEDLPVAVLLRLGELTPDDVAVELVYGPLDTDLQIQAPTVQRMAVSGAAEPGLYAYAASIPCRNSGMHGLAVRVLPHHPELADPYETRLLVWSS
jgi:starch phosphorylase